MYKSLVLIFLLSTSFFLVPSRSVQAQDEIPDRPVYVVQSGDSLSLIALRFGVDMDDLIQANSLIDPNNLQVGDTIAIPGLEGVRGYLASEKVPFGDSLTSISRRYKIPIDLLTRLNHITSPTELYTGVSLIVPLQEDDPMKLTQSSLFSGQSLLEMAVLYGADTWALSQINHLKGTWDAFPGEALFFPAGIESRGSISLHPQIASIEISPLPLVQGKTAVIKISTHEPFTLGGSFAGNELHFFSDESNIYTALQGVHAMAEPGLYPLQLQGTAADGTGFIFEQMVVVESGYYHQEALLGVDPATLDPETTIPETELIQTIITPATPRRLWEGVFTSPGYDPNWITSYFGTRRTYNNDPKIYFHTGLDYGGGTGLPLKAPAPGIVVYTGSLTVRGNAVLIDHGWGVYSGFWHLSEIQVKVGDQVTTGQQIALVGGTGRVTGAHLHWEIWVNGVQVEPINWLDTVFP